MNDLKKLSKKCEKKILQIMSIMIKHTIESSFLCENLTIGMMDSNKDNVKILKNKLCAFV